jgi:hypothetical protein
MVRMRRICPRGTNCSLDGDTYGFCTLPCDENEENPCFRCDMLCSSGVCMPRPPLR